MYLLPLQPHSKTSNTMNLINLMWTDLLMHTAVLVQCNTQCLIVVQLDVLDSGSTQLAWPLTTMLEIAEKHHQNLRFVRQL